MCSPTDISCDNNVTRKNKLSSNTYSLGQQREAPDLETLQEILPTTRNTSKNHSLRLVTAGQVELPSSREGQSQERMSDLVYANARAPSPQYVNSEKKEDLKQNRSPNANLFLPKFHPPSMSAANLTQNYSRNRNAGNFTFNEGMSFSPHSEVYNKSYSHRELNQHIANTRNSASNNSKHELRRNPKLPPPLMLSSDEMQYHKYDSSSKASPSPRDVTQDMHLYNRPGLDSPDTSNKETICHNHQMDFHTVSRASRPQMWPQSSFDSRSSLCGETRQESSPISSSSNSSIATPEDWMSGLDGNSMMRDQPHSSPSMSRNQQYTCHSIYHKQDMRPRQPFSLKPRPNHVYQTPQKQFQGHGQYTTYWDQPISNYRNNPQTSSKPNNSTPPRHTRLSHPTRNLSPVSSTASSTGTTTPPRTSPEILKTLLRKKACLYEPGTSRAITLITWLVARKLALQYGYFSRQHLQSGVHAIVGDKITSGIITRTKVNRCMQVILNSCFYYIIPKPDGTEESGESFRRSFKSTVLDDTALIKTLPEPWNDLEISDKTLINRNFLSPSPSTVHADMKEEEDDNGRIHGSSKRQVLLCFNENVRCAEDVLRCHNDFIRDSAISANLLLTPDEWRTFYLCKDEKSTCATPMKKRTSDESNDSYLSFDMPADVEESLAFKENRSDTQDGGGCDALGQMTTSELEKFRTTWCCKRYEHDATLCRFAHIDVNRGWLRRNPAKYEYSHILCPKIVLVNNKESGLHGCYLNACPDGIRCKFAHSKEEVDYHPKIYKTKVCESTKKGSYRTCDMRDICPCLHPGGDSYCSSTPPRPMTRQSGRRINDTQCRIKGHLIGGKHPTPSVGDSYARAGAPMLYLSPAPVSAFDKTLHFPGLCSLYRRNCATCYAHDVGSEESKYSNFGDNTPLQVPLPSIENRKITNNFFSLFSVV